MAKWTGKTRGNLLGYQILVWFIELTGLKPTYFILRFVSYYFFLFDKESNQHLNDFYKQVIDSDPKLVKKIIRNNYFLLAQSIVDKVALSMGAGNQIQFSNDGENGLRALAEDPSKGGFLISAHLGNWDLAGQYLGGLTSKVNVVMFQNEHEQIKKFLDKQKKASGFQVIPYSADMSHLIAIYQAIKRGELVCMHADRYVENSPTIELDFFKRTAKFPSGPFEIIAKLNAHYSFVFTAKTSSLHYHFSGTKPKKPQKNAEAIAQEFVSILEKKVREHPEQWFNYHDFYA